MSVNKQWLANRCFAPSCHQKNPKKKKTCLKACPRRFCVPIGQFHRCDGTCRVRWGKILNMLQSFCIDVVKCRRGFMHYDTLHEIKRLNRASRHPLSFTNPHDTLRQADCGIIWLKLCCLDWALIRTNSHDLTHTICPNPGDGQVQGRVQVQVIRTNSFKLCNSYNMYDLAKIVHICMNQPPRKMCMNCCEIGLVVLEK